MTPTKKTRGRPRHGASEKKKIHITIDENLHTIASSGNMSRFFNEAGKFFIKSGEFRESCKRRAVNEK